MKKLLAVLFSLMLLFTLACGKGETVKIGFMGPMTGGDSNYGKLMSQAVEIAVEEFNAQGGVLGYKIQLIIEDDQGSVEKGNPAIEKLAGIDKIYGLIGAVFSSVSLAIAPKAEASKIVMISPSSTHKDLPDKGQFVFRDVINDSMQAIVFAKYLYQIEKTDSVAILYVKNDYSQGLAMDFKAQFEKEGGKVVAVETGLKGDKDFKTQLTKIKGLKPKALYIPNYVEEIAQIIEQAKQLGITAKIYSADGFSNPKIFELAPKSANGIIFTQIAENRSQVKKEFIAKYKSKYGEEPDIFALNSYDGAKILMDAIKQSAEIKDKKLVIDRDKVRSIVASTKDFDGASGKITFTPNGDLVANIGIWTSENNEYKQIKAYKLENDKIIEIK